MRKLPVGGFLWLSWPVICPKRIILLCGWIKMSNSTRPIFLQFSILNATYFELYVLFSKIQRDFRILVLFSILEVCLDFGRHFWILTPFSNWAFWSSIESGDQASKKNGWKKKKNTNFYTGTSSLGHDFQTLNLKPGSYDENHVVNAQACINPECHSIKHRFQWTKTALIIKSGNMSRMGESNRHLLICLYKINIITLGLIT